MGDMNVVSVIGRLTRDMESRVTSGGMHVGKFSIAVGKDDTSFFDCVCFGKTVEKIGQYLVKGKQVAVMGSLKQNRWEKDGQKHSKIEILVNNIQLLGGGQARTDSTDDRQFDDDVPF